MPMDKDTGSNMQKMLNIKLCMIPNAMTQSSIPLWIKRLANINALEPEEQLLLTLKTGTPLNPSSYTAFCPQVGSP
jgi:hypothetical protein